MLSKLTLSLTLVLMLTFTLAFVAMPAIAQSIGIANTAVPKDAFAVFSKDEDANGIIITITDFNEANIPDLDELLRFGGVIELSIAVSGAVADDITFTVKTTSKDEDIAKLKHKIILSEIMWGRDRSGGDAAAQVASQWVEIYNSLELATADDLRLHFSATYSGLALGKKVSMDHDTNATNDNVDRVILDRVSTVNRFGVLWAPKGNGGNTDVLAADQGINAIQAAALVSMYRKVNLEDGKYKRDADKNLDGLGDGAEAGSWEASSGRINMSGYYIGSPGSVHVSPGGAAHIFVKAPVSFSATGVIINEVRNDTSDANLDWIELYHNNDGAAAVAQNVENWTLSVVTAPAKADGSLDYRDQNQVILPKYKLQPGEYLVIYNRDPGDTILAGGVSIEEVAAGRQINKGASHVYFIADKTDDADALKPLDLPSGEKFLLLLRNGKDKVETHEELVDYAGNGFFTRVEANKFNTEVWPFMGWDKPDDVAGFGDRTFAGGGKAWGRTTVLSDMGMYRPKSRADNRIHEEDWEGFGFVGSGYDRDVDPASAPGTPGYANVAVNVVTDDRDNAVGTSPYAFGGAISISEVMYDAGPRWNLVQWIELYNSSMTEAVNIGGWELEIRNKEDVESYIDSSFEFKGDTVILPNQTLLLVSGTGANDVASNRVYSLYAHHRRALGLLARDSILLSRTGFYLKLTAKSKSSGDGRTNVDRVMDEVGNVRVEGAQRTVLWALPARDLVARQSLIRQYGTRDIDGTRDAASEGTMASSWHQSDLIGAGLSYYGHRNDVGTPGFRLGGPLPVSLSSFRPVRDKTTGAVVIKWVTESELNNAGFNILRSESRDGAFQVVNLKGIIAGNGTTGERHAYQWTDITAKPNVVYYYQIEDVSLDGKRTTLGTTHLRGSVTSAGKLTTTWGDLKL